MPDEVKTKIYVDQSLSVGLTVAELKVWDSRVARFQRSVDAAFAAAPASWNMVATKRFARRFEKRVRPASLFATAIPTESERLWMLCACGPTTEGGAPGVSRVSASAEVRHIWSVSLYGYRRSTHRCNLDTGRGDRRSVGMAKGNALGAVRGVRRAIWRKGNIWSCCGLSR